MGRLPLVVAAATPPQGRLLLVADHSVFINEMLMHGDNAIFAWNCVNWLCEGDRKRLVFMDEGKVLRGLPLDASQLPPVPISKAIDALLRSGVPLPQQGPKLTDSSLRKAANQFITSLEDKDYFNASLAARQRRIQPWKARRAALMLATAVVGLVCLRRLLMGRWRPDRTSDDRPVSSEPRQNDSQVHVGRFEHCVTALAREFFSQDLETSAGTDWQQLADPQVDLDQPLRRRIVIRHRIRLLWGLATRRNGRSIREREFGRLVARLADLQGLRRAGRLRLQWPSHEPAGDASR